MGLIFCLPWLSKKTQFSKFFWAFSERRIPVFEGTSIWGLWKGFFWKSQESWSCQKRKSHTLRICLKNIWIKSFKISPVTIIDFAKWVTRYGNFIRYDYLFLQNESPVTVIPSVRSIWYSRVIVFITCCLYKRFSASNKNLSIVRLIL